MNYLPQHDIICCVLEKPFATWSHRDQLDVIKTGRPDFMRKIRHDYNSFKKAQSTQMHWYLTYDWLCWSTYLEGLFCWPCLLFAEPEHRWVFQDENFSEDFRYASTLFDRHSEQNSHTQSVSKLHATRRRKVVSDDRSLTEEIQLNRSCTMFAIDAILYIIRNGMALGEVSGEGVGNHADLVELLMSQSSELPVKKHFKKIRSSLLSSTIQYRIVNIIAEIIEEHIKKAVDHSDFFVLRIDNGIEWNDISLFLRFFDSTGNLKENLLGCYDLGGDKTYIALLNIVNFVMSRYQYSSKLVGVSYEATCVNFKCLKDLRVGLKFMAPQAVNVNLLSHNLYFGLLENCLISIPSHSCQPPEFLPAFSRISLPL